MKTFRNRLRTDPDHPDADLLPTLEKTQDYRKWSDREHKAFIKAVRKYGKNYPMITNIVRTKNIERVREHVKILCNQIRADPKHPDSDLLQILNERAQIITEWTEE